MGYYNTILPGVIQRNILENPGWYLHIHPIKLKLLKDDWKLYLTTKQWFVI